MFRTCKDKIDLVSTESKHLLAFIFFVSWDRYTLVRCSFHRKFVVEYFQWSAYRWWNSCGSLMFISWSTVSWSVLYRSTDPFRATASPRTLIWCSVIYCMRFDVSVMQSWIKFVSEYLSDRIRLESGEEILVFFSHHKTSIAYLFLLVTLCWISTTDSSFPFAGALEGRRAIVSIIKRTATMAVL